MSHTIAFVLCLAGFAALALATKRQQDEVFGRALAPALTARLFRGGWAALVLALVVLVALRGWGMGLVLYSGHTSLAAALVFVALILRARRCPAPRSARRRG